MIMKIIKVNTERKIFTNCYTFEKLSMLFTNKTKDYAIFISCL